MPHVTFHTFPVPEFSSPAFSSLAFSASPFSFAGDDGGSCRPCLSRPTAVLCSRSAACRRCRCGDRRSQATAVAGRYNRCGACADGLRHMTQHHGPAALGAAESADTTRPRNCSMNSRNSMNGDDASVSRGRATPTRGPIIGVRARGLGSCSPPPKKKKLGSSIFWAVQFFGSWGFWKSIFFPDKKYFYISHLRPAKNK